MTYLISGEEIEITWQSVELIENHGSGCTEHALVGEGSDGNTYIATGTYQGDELEEVNDIEIQ